MDGDDDPLVRLCVSVLFQVGVQRHGAAGFSLSSTNFVINRFQIVYKYEDRYQEIRIPPQLTPFCIVEYRNSNR